MYTEVRAGVSVNIIYPSVGRLWRYNGGKTDADQSGGKERRTALCKFNFTVYIEATGKNDIIFTSVHLGDLQARPFSQLVEIYWTLKWSYAGCSALRFYVPFAEKLGC